MNLRALSLALLILCAGCRGTPRAPAQSAESVWVPVELNLDDKAVHPGAEAYVYVDGGYRGNFVDGRFRIYLTLDEHLLRVYLPGYEEWLQPLVLTAAEFPAGKTFVVSPVLEQPAPTGEPEPANAATSES